MKCQRAAKQTAAEADAEAEAAVARNSWTRTRINMMSVLWG